MNILTTLFHNAHHQSAGKFHSIRSDRPHPFLPGEKMGADVSLSINAMRLVEIFKDEATSEEVLVATGYDQFALNFYLQLEEKGKQADILKEVPKSSDPARIALSQQATNYFLTALYGEESLHIGVSEENPFAQLDRLTLSNTVTVKVSVALINFYAAIFSTFVTSVRSNVIKLSAAPASRAQPADFTAA